MTSEHRAGTGPAHDGQEAAPDEAAPRPAHDQRRRTPRRVTTERLKNRALHHLARFASSSANLRRVLLRSALKSAKHHGTDPAAAGRMVDAVIADLERVGLLDDTQYAEATARSLARAGRSAAFIRAKLTAKGVGRDEIDAALAALAEEAGDAELASAVALARRKRIGPYRPRQARAENRQRDLAALARAGFRYDLARRVIDAENAEDLEEEADTPFF